MHGDGGSRRQRPRAIIPAKPPVRAGAALSAEGDPSRTLTAYA